MRKENEMAYIVSRRPHRHRGVHGHLRPTSLAPWGVGWCEGRVGLVEWNWTGSCEGKCGCGVSRVSQLSEDFTRGGSFESVKKRSYGKVKNHLTSYTSLATWVENL